VTKLYELTQNYMELLGMVDSLDEETFKDTLSAIEEALEDKVENTAKFVRCLDGDIEAIKAEEKRLADRRRALETKVGNCKSYLQEQLEFAGIDKIKRPTVTVSIQANPPSAFILDESLIPSDYMIAQAPTIDKRSILKALKEGEFIPGAEIKQSRSVRIR
jgi:hypothetical protein